MTQFLNKHISAEHTPRKRFSQNFLVDKNVVAQIIRVMALQASDHAVEIGPGLGVLTFEIIGNVARFDAIEIDRDLVYKLNAAYGGRKDFCLHCADALSFDLNTLNSCPHEEEHGQGHQQSCKSKCDGYMRLIGNLPYNITTPLLFHLMQYAAVIQDMHFMVQREVADRLVAGPGSKTYGRLSIMMQYYARVEKLFDVAPSAFAPQPQVYSSLVKLVPFRKLPIVADDIEIFSKTVQTAFNQRRKTLRNCLKTLIDSTQLEKLSIDPQLRPEQLSLEHFVKISNMISGKFR